MAEEDMLLVTCTHKLILSARVAIIVLALCFHFDSESYSMTDRWICYVTGSRQCLSVCCNVHWLLPHFLCILYSCQIGFGCWLFAWNKILLRSIQLLSAYLSVWHTRFTWKRLNLLLWNLMWHFAHFFLLDMGYQIKRLKLYFSKLFYLCYSVEHRRVRALNTNQPRSRNLSNRKIWQNSQGCIYVKYRPSELIARHQQ